MTAVPLIVFHVCDAIRRSKLADRGIDLALVDHPLRMESIRCWRLGLIVNEFITNAVRHAFDGIGGEIRVELLPLGALIECRVSDNGNAVTPIRPGRGLRIVARLAQALDGTVAHVVGGHGSAAILTFPADAEVYSNLRDVAGACAYR